MNSWEQIFFAVTLAIFGWLLFTANKKIASSQSVTSGASSEGNVAPWFLTYNSAAGLTGQLFSTGVTGAGTVAPNLSIGQDGQSTSDNLFPYPVQV